MPLEDVDEGGTELLSAEFGPKDGSSVWVVNPGLRESVHGLSEWLGRATDVQEQEDVVERGRWKRVKLTSMSTGPTDWTTTMVLSQSSATMLIRASPSLSNVKFRLIASPADEATIGMQTVPR